MDASMSYTDAANADILATQIPAQEQLLTLDDVLPMVRKLQFELGGKGIVFDTC